MPELVTDPNLINELSSTLSKENKIQLPSNTTKITDTDLINELSSTFLKKEQPTTTAAAADTATIEAEKEKLKRAAMPLTSIVMDTLAAPVSGTIETVKNFFTGTKTTEFPEMEGFYTSNKAQEALKDLTLGQKAAVTAGPLITTDQKMLADIIKTNVKNSDITQDKFGNPIVVLADGQTYYLNKPGVDLEDTAQFTSQMLQMIPGYSQISKALAGRLLLRSLSQGAYTGGVSVAQDIAAGQLADKTVPESIDLKKAGVATALGFGLEFVGSPILNTLFNNLAKNSRFFTVDAITGAPTLTEVGENAVKALGIDTAGMSKEKLGSLFKEIRTGKRGLIGQMAAEDSGFGFDLAKAQASGDRNDLSFFYAALNGKYGERYKEMANKFLEKQNLKIGQTAQTILSKFEKGEIDLKTLEESGDAVKKAINEQYKAANNKINTAYNIIDKNGVFQGANSNIDNLQLSITKALQERGGNLEPELYPATDAALKAVKDFIEKIKVDPKSGTEKATPITLNSFEMFRKKLSNYFDSGKNQTDKRNIVAIKEQFDKFYDDAIDSFLFGNNKVEDLKAARGAYKLKKDLFGDKRKYVEGFEIKDPAGSAIVKILGDPDVTPKQTINYIFGSADIGAGPTSLQIVRRLKTIFGVDDMTQASKNGDFQELRNALIQRAYEGSIDPRTGVFSPAKLVNQWNKLLNKNSDLMKELYTNEEINTFKTFIDKVRKTLPPRDMANMAAVKSVLTRTIEQAGRGVAGAAALKQGGINFLLAARNVWDRAVESVYLEEGKKRVLEQMGKLKLGTSVPSENIPFVGKAIKDLFENNKSLIPGTSYQTPTPSVTDILNVITTTGVKGRQQDLNAPLIPTELAKRGIAKTKAPAIQPKAPAAQPRTEVPVLDRNMMTASTTPTAGTLTNIPKEQLDKYTTLFGPVV